MRPQVVETSIALDAAKQASTRKADSILHHTLKNTMADSAGDIDIFLQTTHLDAAACAPLRNAVASLRRGMRSCRHRQAYLRLSANDYVPALQPVNTSEFAHELTAGRHMTLRVKELWVQIDPTLCRCTAPSPTAQGRIRTKQM